MKLWLLEAVAIAAVVFAVDTARHLGASPDTVPRSLGDATEDKLRTLALRPHDITEELARTGKVVRRKAREANPVTAEATSDVHITAAIRAKVLKNGDLAVLDISVNCTQGVVTVSGLVPSAEDIARAMLLAMETEGVREVISTLGTQQTEPLLADSGVGLAATYSGELSQVFSCLPGVIIKLPAGWKRIERQALDQSFDEVMGMVPNAHLIKEQAVTGFQAESDAPGIGFPRIIVVTNMIGRLSDRDLKAQATSLRELQASANSSLRGSALKTSAKISDVGYDDQHHFLRVAAVVSVPGSVTLHVVSIIFATEYGAVTFQFTATDEQYERLKPLFSKVIAGIQVIRPE